MSKVWLHQIQYLLDTAPLDTDVSGVTIDVWITDEGRFIGGATREFKTELTSPSKPDTPSGPTTGRVNRKYTYTTSATDPNDDDIYYCWDWDGDDIIDEWTDDAYPSGQTISTSTKWNKEYSGHIKVRCQDINGEFGPWSDPLPITMPKNKPYLNTPFLNLLEQYPHLFLLLRQLLRL